tara:strand:+ start:216202 stop:216915 length:714 start_codon:yes stop_codon:yes gene_type:complete
MTLDKLEFEVYEPSFDEISDVDSDYYDECWYESESLPYDHDWYEIIGAFLLMRVMIAKYEYTGKNSELQKRGNSHLKKFKRLLPDVEEHIRYSIMTPEFTILWAEFCKAYTSLGLIKREENSRKERGEYDRGTEQRRVWFACVYMKEKAKGKHRKVIQYEIAKFAELIKAGEIPTPLLWSELKFEKILHKKSSLAEPKLNNDLRKEMSVRKDIPFYADKACSDYKLPPFDIKVPDSD